MPHPITRRTLLATGSALIAAPRMVRAAAPLRLGLTPVFLDNDAAVVDRLSVALREGTGEAVDLVQRRTYAEVTGLLLEGGVDAAWLCGYPYLQHEADLRLLAVPVWQGAPTYRSYLIAGTADPATTLADLRGGNHAFSDPDSNSGWLVTASDLVRMGETPDAFFARTIFAYGHRNVVRAVAGALVRSGSVDGYVWEALARVEPALTSQTRVIGRSEPLGFPPFVVRRDRAGSGRVDGLAATLLGLGGTAAGRQALAMLQLDRMTTADPSLYDGIRARMRDLAG